MSRIHPTAIVCPGAEVDSGVEVGPYAYIGPHVKIGSGSQIQHHATVDGYTEMGEGNLVYPYACIGLKSQDVKHKGGRTDVVIGSGNTFREFCTVHAATAEGAKTVIGSDNLFLAYSHVAHDCVVGSHIIMSNSVNLAGHVILEDHVVVGGMTGIHQFCRVGAYTMIGAMSKVVQDVPPFVIADGNPLFIRGINKIGLERKGFTPEQLQVVRGLYRHFFRSGLNRSQAIAGLPEGLRGDLADQMVQSLRAGTRGCTSAA